MKAKHRHELKTNELAEWIGNLPQWAKENLRMIIAVSAVIIVAIGSYYYFGYQRKVASAQEQLRLTDLTTRLLPTKRDVLLSAQYRGEDISFMLIQTAGLLETFANSAKNDTIAAFALIKRAEALRTELHYRPGTVSKQDLTQQITLAKDSYSRAVERLGGPSYVTSQDGSPSGTDSPASGHWKSSSNPSLMAMAKFGLGLCEEELGNFEGARKIYLDIAADPDFESTVTVAQAKLRLDAMADYRQKVVFQAPPKPPPPAPVPRPVQLPPTEANLPAANIIDTNLVDKSVADTNAAERIVVDTNLADISLVDVNVAAP